MKSSTFVKLNCCMQNDYVSFTDRLLARFVYKRRKAEKLIYITG